MPRHLLAAALCLAFARPLVAESPSPFTGEVKPVLYVLDAERSARYYRDVLGFELDGFAGEPSDPYYAEMLAGPLKVGLHEPTMEGDGELVGHQRLIFRVRDLEAQRRRVEERGGDAGQIVRRSWMDFFRVRDPDGNELVFAVTDAARHSSQPWSRDDPAPAAAPPPEETSGRTATLLFGYSPRPGREREMEEGYRQHLDWHREVSDPLPWFGWTVVQGDRLGWFIDGTFGIRFEQFEARPDPAADLSHAQDVFLPHVEPRFRQILRYRAELSGSATLEERLPSPLVQAAWVELGGAEVGLLEDALREPGLRSWGIAVYERLTGGPRPGYLLLQPTASLTDLPETGPDAIASLLSRLHALAGRPVRLEIETELWRYRPALSLVPGS